MYSYNFMTPVDENNSRYYYLQLRNVQPQSAEVSTALANGVRGAFLEDKVNPRVKPIVLGIDAGPRHFRQQLGRRIEREAGATTQMMV
jgi:Vanillate O-demethylase oxygenase C-terminal domain